MRLHGNREPHVMSVKSAGGQEIASGADNEIWSYGQEAEKNPYQICSAQREYEAIYEGDYEAGT